MEGYMRRVGVAVVGVVVMVGGFVGTASESHAGVRAGAAALQRWALTGSTRYLVYAQTRSSRPHGLGDRGVVYARSRTGHRRQLDKFNAARPLSLVGSFLVQGSGSGTGSPVRWENLGTGRTGTARLAKGQKFVAAAPDGWIVSTPGATAHAARRLLELRPGGRRVDLGIPFPDGSPYVVDPGPSGAVAWSSGDASTPGDGLVRFMSWGHPGEWRTIFEATPKATATLECGGTQATPTSVTAGYVACTVSGYKKRRADLQALIPLRSGRAVLSPANCLGAPVVLRSSEIWMSHTNSRKGCAAGWLYRFSATTTTTRLAGRYLPIDPVQAFGGVIVQTSRGHLRLLGKLSAKPTRIV